MSTFFTHGRIAVPPEESEREASSAKRRASICDVPHGGQAVDPDDIATYGAVHLVHLQACAADGPADGLPYPGTLRQVIAQQELDCDFMSHMAKTVVSCRRGLRRSRGTTSASRPTS